MIKIKICGITSLEDALVAADAGADALGFMFYKPSKRYIKPGEARKIISMLPPFIGTVGVFVNQTSDEIISIQKEAGFDIIQLHGDESADFCRKFERAIKAIRIKDRLNHSEIDSYPVQAILFDKYSEESYGGTGKSFSWEILKNLRISKKIILSGGLSSENVARAISVVNPYAVDVSSGVEERPGKKSAEKIKKLIEAVRDANKF